MRVGFDGLSIAARPSGVGGTAHRLLVAMARRADAPEIVAVLPSDSAADEDVAGLSNVTVVRAPVPGPDTPRALWFQHVVDARRMRDARIDVFLAPAFVLPLRDVGAPSVVVVHDAAWRRFPETKTLRFRTYVDAVVPRSIRRAALVVAPSEFARREALSLAPDVDPARVRVIPWGAPAPRTNDGDPGVPRPYVLCVSNLDRRKNLPKLVAAWRHLRDAGEPRALVLAGGDAERRDALLRDVGGADERLVLTGYVDEARLAALYAHADAVVVPSVYEGFGLPVLEAFAAGVPVACSNASSLPEVAGDAAVLFDPDDSEDMARAVGEALRPGAERDARIARGRLRAAALTWERCAEAYARLLDEAATSGRRA